MDRSLVCLCAFLTSHEWAGWSFFLERLLEWGPAVYHLFHWQLFSLLLTPTVQYSSSYNGPLITTAALHSFCFCLSAPCVFLKPLTFLYSPLLSCVSPWIDPSSTVSPSWCVLGFDNPLESPPHQILIRVLASCCFDGCWYVFHLPEE